MIAATAMSFISVSLTAIYIKENINRDTVDNLLKAGFDTENIRIEKIWFVIGKLIRLLENFAI